jgi:acyl-CoA thioesterase
MDPDPERSGLSYYEAITARGRDANPFLRLMGVEILRAGNGEAVLGMTVRPKMRNGEGWLQGGLFVALADESMALALYSVLGRKDRIATISESTQFLKGVRAGELHAVGRVTRKGRRVAFAEGEIHAGSGGELLARTIAAFAVTAG